jgi:radical SAM superfamily enzyme YgiQ (UPF0313 family)
MTKVLMVYPRTPSTYWSFDQALPFIGKRAALPPLGLMTVAAMLPPGYEVRLVDMNVAPLRRQDIEAADIVFLSAMIVQKDSFEEVVRLCNDCGVRVVAGGPYPTTSHERIKGVDAFVLGEAELTLGRMLQDLEAGHLQRVYRSDDRADLATTPPPRFDIIDLEAYDSMPLQYSRGCPYSCEFCDIIELFGRVQRTKTPQQFARELDAVYNAGFRGQVFIVDDNFVGNRARTRELMRTVVAWQTAHDFPFTLSTEASIDLARDEQLLSLMEQARFTMVFVGIETPDEETLRFTNKMQNVRASVLDSVRTIQSRGIEVTGGFIVGFDTDPGDIFERQIRFIQEAAIPVAMVGLLTALPGTQLDRRLASEGRLLAESTGNNTHDLNVNFVPRMPLPDLLRGYARVLAEVYRPRRYFARCRELMRRLPRSSVTVRGISWGEVRALLLSVLKQTFSSYGLSYLRFIGGTIALRARRFPDAVGHAVKGFHFFSITRRVLALQAFETLVADETRRLSARVAAAVGEGRARLARETRGAVLRVQARLTRLRRRLTADLRPRADRSFAAFAERCSLWLAELQPIR